MLRSRKIGIKLGNKYINRNSFRNYRDDEINRKRF